MAGKIMGVSWSKQGWMSKATRTLIFVAAFLLAGALICWVVVVRPF